jgi:hypothetical protein
VVSKCRKQKVCFSSFKKSVLDYSPTNALTNYFRI